MNTQINLGPWLTNNLHRRAQLDPPKEPEDLLPVLGELLASEDLPQAEVLKLAYCLGQLAALKVLSRDISPSIHGRVLTALRDFDFDGLFNLREELAAALHRIPGPDAK